MTINLRTWGFATPYTVTDAINRVWAATGSVNTAMATADADWNGHRVSLTWNDYRGYYVAQYHWGERVVLHRGTDLRAAIRAVYQDHAVRSRGGSLYVTPRPADESTMVELVATDFPDLHETKPGTWAEDTASWRTWRHDAAGEAVDLNRRYGVPYQLLDQHEDLESWRAACRDYIRTARIRPRAELSLENL